MALASPVELTLRAGPLTEADLAVSRVEGRERLSEPYDLVVEAWSSDGASFDLGAVLGREARLRLRHEADGTPRAMQGAAKATRRDRDDGKP